MSEEPQKSEGNKPKDDDDAWIEKVVNVAGNLGFNKMRLRWKLIRWQEKRKKERNLAEQERLRIDYAHKTCGECGAIQDRDEKICTACGKKLSSRTWQILGRMGLTSPKAVSVSTLLAVAILFAYARVWIAQGGGFGAPSGYLLVDFGGTWKPLIADEPWRLLTSVFLHAGLLHLAFNLLAIASIGPRIEELYGRATTAGIFIISGVIAAYGSIMIRAGGGVGIGASGALMGLIGLAAGYGHRAGRGRGHGLRDDMLKWSAYTFVFGFAVGADNWAHLFGALVGAAFGLAVKPAWWTRRRWLPARILLGLIGAAGAIGALVLILTRVPTTPEEREAQTRVETSSMLVSHYGAMCVAYYANDLPKAIAAAKEFAADFQIGDDKLDATGVELMCDGIQQMRVVCATRDKLDRETRAEYDAMCTMYEPLFQALPVRAPKSPADP
jgi:membrane associated rhomboid family serine protease